MTKDELITKLKDIEWDDFEVKEAANGLPKSIGETVSAFSVEFSSDLVCSTVTYFRTVTTKDSDNITEDSSEKVTENQKSTEKSTEKSIEKSTEKKFCYTFVKSQP